MTCEGAGSSNRRLRRAGRRNSKLKNQKLKIGYREMQMTKSYPQTRKSCSVARRKSWNPNERAWSCKFSTKQSQAHKSRLAARRRSRNPNERIRTGKITIKESWMLHMKARKLKLLIEEKRACRIQVAQARSDNRGSKGTQSPYEGPKAQIFYRGEAGPSESRLRRIGATIMALKVHNLYTKARKPKFLIERTVGFKKALQRGIKTPRRVP